MSKQKPKLLVIGSKGFLGSYVVHVAATDFCVIEGNRSANNQSGGVRVDIQDEGSVTAAFDAERPDAVMLLAANSDIDACERNPQEARGNNVYGAAHVAEACDRINARLLFTSSGAVFDGKKHGYTENDPVNPVSVYGETKAQAERLVVEIVSEAVVVRFGLVIGFSGRQGTNSLLDTLSARWNSEQTVEMPVFEHRNPIDALTCSRYLVELIQQQRGIFHIGSTDSISRYDLGLKLASRMGHADKMSPQLEPQQGRAPRGPDQFLLTDKLRKITTIPIPTCEQVIERCFHGAT
jgi:dTDP-4-dehydrorhamnose reductase